MAGIKCIPKGMTRRMKILLTGHKGYIGAVAGPILQVRRPRSCGAGYGPVSPAVTSARRPRKFRKSARTCATSPRRTLRDSMRCCTLPRCQTILWAIIDPSLTYDINHLASVRLAEMAKAAGVKRFVFSSSCSTYGAAGDAFHDETARVQSGNALRGIQGSGGARRGPKHGGDRGGFQVGEIGPMGDGGGVRATACVALTYVDYLVYLCFPSYILK